MEPLCGRLERANGQQERTTMSTQDTLTTYSFEDAGMRTVVVCDRHSHVLVYARGERATFLESLALRMNQRQASSDVQKERGS